MAADAGQSASIPGLLHIGMFKCMSTSIQQYFLEDKDSFFMGIGPTTGHVAKEVLYACQTQIFRTPAPFYKQELVSDVFRAGIETAASNRRNAFVLSDETITFALETGLSAVSYTERLARLRAVMPENTTVLMMVRQPAKLLWSAYKHMRSHYGLGLSYEEFLKWLLLKGDTYLLATGKFYELAKEAARIFGAVKVVAMESCLQDDTHLGTALSDTGIAVGGPLPKANESLSDAQFGNLVSLDRHFSDARAMDYLTNLTPIEVQTCQSDTGYFGTVLATHMANRTSFSTLQNLAGQLPAAATRAEFDISDETRKRLAAYFRDSNQGLRDEFGIDTEALAYDIF